MQRRSTQKRIPTPVSPTRGQAGSRRHARSSSRSIAVLKRDASIIAVLGATLLMVHVFEYACIARAGYERARLRAEIRTLQQENSNLRADVEILERPQRIDMLARQCGMVQRNDADYIALAPLPPTAVNTNRPMIAGFVPEWLNRLVHHTR